jgi:hypothetical protein
MFYANLIDPLLFTFFRNSVEFSLGKIIVFKDIKQMCSYVLDSLSLKVILSK